jgi:hypothetical protein
MLAPMTAKTARLWIAGSGALGAAALAYVATVDPHRPGAVFPFCPFQVITGWDCPACGGLRMTHDVLHGNLSAAVHDNVFLLIGLPLLAVWSLWRLHRGRQVVSTALLIVLGVATIGWTVVRNLPGFPLVPTMLIS